MAAAAAGCGACGCCAWLARPLAAYPASTRRVAGADTSPRADTSPPAVDARLPDTNAPRGLMRLLARRQRSSALLKDSAMRVACTRGYRVTGSNGPAELVVAPHEGLPFGAAPPNVPGRRAVVAPPATIFRPVPPSAAWLPRSPTRRSPAASWLQRRVAGYATAPIVAASSHATGPSKNPPAWAAS